MGVKTLHTWDRVGGGDNDTAKFEMREGGCVPPHPFPPTLCKLLHRGSTGGKRLGRFLGLILIQNYFFGDGGGWVGWRGEKVFLLFMSQILLLLFRCVCSLQQPFHLKKFCFWKLIVRRTSFGNPLFTPNSSFGNLDNYQF